MDKIQSVQNTLTASASQLQESIKSKTTEMSTEVHKSITSTKNEAQKLAQDGRKYAEDAKAYVKEYRESVTEQVESYKKLAGEQCQEKAAMVQSYKRLAEDQVKEYRESVTEQVESYKKLAGEQCQEKAAMVRNVVMDISTPYVKSEFMRDRVIPLSNACSEGLDIVKTKTIDFIDCRVAETDIDRESASHVDLAKAFVGATYTWLVTQMQLAQLVVLQSLNETRSQISMEEYTDGTYQFYLKWSALILFAVYEHVMKCLPLDRDSFEKRVLEIKDTTASKGSDVVENIRSRTQEPLKLVSERVEPLKDVIIERSARVETLLKQTFVGEIFEKGISSLKNGLQSGSGSITDLAADPSDTTEASPSATTKTMSSESTKKVSASVTEPAPVTSTEG